MSGLTKDQKKLATILRILAEEIESNRGLTEKIYARLEKHEFSRKHENRASVDVFQILAKEGKEGLLEFLDTLELDELKRIISKHRLDPSGLSLKWRKKQRLIGLIVERTRSRSVHGDVFMKQKENST
jgi:hypothetical protein